MKKTIHLLIFLFLVGFVAHSTVQADWWDRPSVQPTQPSIERNLPTSVPPPEPTQQPVQQPTQSPTTPPSQPTAATIPSPTQTSPTQTPSSGGAGQGGPLAGSDDPCASGKSYSGQYCGWSPGVGGGSEEGSSSTEQPQILAKVGGPSVKGLSKTGSGDVTPSGIILLTGILCLLLYAKSKIEFRKAL